MTACLPASDDPGGKVAIVAGAMRKRGLRRQIALCLARAGADVVVIGIGKESVEALAADERESGWRGTPDAAEEVRTPGVHAFAMAVDVTSSIAVRQLLAVTTAALGGIDILVNNAAFARGQLVGRMPHDIVVRTDA